MNGSLSLAEAIAILRRGEPVTITVCTLDLKRNKGGERKEWHDVRVLEKDNPEDIIQEKGEQRPESVIAKRRPDHRANHTINIRLMNDEIIKIHLPLMEKINGQRIAL